jgi:hypothetical protein
VAQLVEQAGELIGILEPSRANGHRSHLGRSMHARPTATSLMTPGPDSELDSAWTVRFGPLPRDHMRAVLDQYAW